MWEQNSVGDEPKAQSLCLDIHLAAQETDWLLHHVNGYTVTHQSQQIACWMDTNPFGLSPLDS